MAGVKVIPISEARPNLTSLVEEVSQGKEPCFIASHGRVKAVLLGIEEYNALIEHLEDLEDSLDILKARAKGEPTRPLEEFIGGIEPKRPRDVRRRA